MEYFCRRGMAYISVEGMPQSIANEFSEFLRLHGFGHNGSKLMYTDAEAATVFSGYFVEENAALIQEWLKKKGAAEKNGQ